MRLEGVENVPGAIFRRVARVAAGRNRGASCTRVAAGRNRAASRRFAPRRAATRAPASQIVGASPNRGKRLSPQSGQRVVERTKSKLILSLSKLILSLSILSLS